MDLRLTIMTPGRVGAVVDVVVTAAPGTPLRGTLPELCATLGVETADGEISCEGIVLDPAHPLGTPPLTQGATLVLGRSVRPAPPLLEAHAVAGPDAGATWPLRAGANPVGRSSSSPISPRDEDVSREHAEIVVEPGRLIVRDRGSTNGTWVDGRRIPGETTIEAGQEVTVGATTLVVGRMPRPPAATVADGEGHIRVNRRPDVRPARPSVAIAFPARPDDRVPARLPWPALLLPLLLAVPMAFFWRQPAFLAFALMSPLLMAGQYLYDQRSGRREAAGRLRSWQEVTAATKTRLVAAVDHDARLLRELRPDLAELAAAATTPTDDLWRRSPGEPAFLHLRLGRGPEAGAVTVRRPGNEPPGGDSHAEAVVHPEVPVVVDLRAVSVLGVCGPREEVLGLARSLIGQVAVLHAPGDVGVTLLAADAPGRAEWQWVARLPHHRNFGTGVGPRVVVLDGRLRSEPAVAEVLGATADGRGSRPEAVAFVICLAGSEQELPVECGAIVTLASDGRSGTLWRSGHEPVEFAPDLAGRRWAERISRGLAPLRETAGADDLPREVRLADLVTAAEGFDPSEPEAVARHWRRAGPRGPTALIGAGPAGPVRVDLRRDGPHALVGGTTGAGKSELLQTLITGLAIDSGPDEVSFLLVDYKGGAAFRECLGLPHVTGLITDLDHRLAARALASLRAELRRRERILGGAGAADIDELGQLAGPGRLDDPCRLDGPGRLDGRLRGGERRGMPRLVVVVDEFRVLAEELPDFVGGLMRVAVVGRSLGVHLVLATQRPAGIVSPEIAANTNLRVALRLRDEGDSRDLVDDPAAARLPGDRPGRALLRVGAGAVHLMQTARVRGGRPEPTGPVVRRADPAAFSVAGQRQAPVVGTSSQTDLALLADGLRGAAKALGVDRPAPPWLPPLPAIVEPVPSKKGVAVIGLVDLPEEQRRRPLTWPLDGRHLAVAGGPRSGRTTTARTLAQAAAGAGARVHVVDGSGALADLEALAGVEAVVATGDLERCERLLRRLRGAGPAVLVVDGWEGLVAAWNDLDHGRLVDELTGLLRDGPAAGLQVAVTGGRTLLTGAVSSLLAERLVLRFADPADAVLAGVRGGLMSRSMPPGRAVHLGPDDPDGHEAQIARPAPVPAGRRTSSLPALPRLLDHVDWSRRRSRSTTPGVPVGIGGDDAEPVNLVPAALTVILGPPGSGRSTALRAIAETLGGQALLVTPDRPDPAAVAAALRSGMTVLVDDARGPSAAGDSPTDRIGELIVEHLGSHRDPGEGPGVVLACSPAEILSGFRGLPVVARGARQGLVLGNAGAAAAEVFGVRAQVHPGAPPGRAILVRDGRTTVVQLPLPPDDPAQTDHPTHTHDLARSGDWRG